MFERLLNTPLINDIADVFNKPAMSHREIEKAGAEFMCKCYEEKSSTSLNNLRQKMLIKKIINAKSFVKPERLKKQQSTIVIESINRSKLGKVRKSTQLIGDG